jgi:hypothetical protein
MSWTLPCCTFLLWLAINNQCWTTDRLAKQNLSHPAACPLCDQAEETIEHSASILCFLKANLGTGATETEPASTCSTASGGPLLKLVERYNISGSQEMETKL